MSWLTKQAGVQINQVPCILQEALVRDWSYIKVSSCHPVRTVSAYLGIYMIIIHQRHFRTDWMVYGFTSEWFCPVETLPSGLNAHGALAIMSAPFRSCPSFPHYMCQWARRMARVTLVVNCGTRSTLRRWSFSNCERRCHVSANIMYAWVLMFVPKRTLSFRDLRPH